MAYSYWLGALGNGIFFIGLVTAIILYATKRKFYPVMYLASISLYMFTIGFVIDAFDVGKNGILLLLALSAIIFIFLGFFFSSRWSGKKEDFAKNIPSRR